MRALGKKRGKKKPTLKQAFHLWDHIVAGLLVGSGVIEPQDRLGMSNIGIDFGGLHSNSYVTKYFVITKYPDWIAPRITDIIRMNCLDAGVKVNFYVYGQPHSIPWESDEVKNRMAALRRFTENQKTADETSVFDYRKSRKNILAQQRVLNSMQYLNEADLDFRRTLWLNTILVEISGKRGYDGRYLSNMRKSIVSFQRYCASTEIEYREIKVNVQDWLSVLSPFSLKLIKEVNTKIPKKTFTDDIMANFVNSYKQGKIGQSGILVGVDISSKLPVMVDFRLNKDNAENWLISATTGGGKSYFTKHLLTWLLAVNIAITVVDFEGDEYKELAAYVKSGNPDDVSVVSMGKGNSCYCDPMPIPNLTGDEEIDSELKDNAIGFTTKIFQTIVSGGTGEQLTKWQESVLSTAIKNVYNNYGVTDDRDTWKNSQACSVHKVYKELSSLVRRKKFLDESMENIKHKAAVDILEACRPYFEEGESKFGTFKNPIKTDELYKSKLVIFSFGEKGKTASEMDKVAVQLKQLSVANISNQISNYHKYVRKALNVKVWEEYQRWSAIPGSSEIIKNVITGGRKRGDINFIITNDLSSILDDTDANNRTIRGNITSYAIGKLKDKTIIDNFVTKCRLEDLRMPLESISDATKISGSKFYKAFCVVMNDSEKAIVKVMLPEELRETPLYSTVRGVN